MVTNSSVVKNEIYSLCKKFSSNESTINQNVSLYLRKINCVDYITIPTIITIECELETKMKNSGLSESVINDMKAYVRKLQTANIYDPVKLIYFLKEMSIYSDQSPPINYRLQTTGLRTSTPLSRTYDNSVNKLQKNEISSINSMRSTIPVESQSSRFLGNHTPLVESQRNNASISSTPRSHIYQISNDLTEFTVIGEMLFIVLGNNGSQLSWDDALQKLSIRDGGILPFSMHWHVLRFCQCGSAYKKIRAYIDRGINNQSCGVVYQGFCVALNEHLSSFVTLVASLQSQYNNWAAELEGRISNSNRQTHLTLEMLLLKLHEPMEVLFFLVDIICDSGDLQGGQLASVMYKYLLHGTPEKVKLTRNLLLQAVEPFYQFIQQWIYDGILEESYHEFFVAVSSNYDFNSSWTDKYGLRTNMIPNFITASEAQKILLSGKSINFLREVCLDKTMLKEKKEIAATMSLTAESMINQMVDRRFENVIQSVYEVTSKHLLEVMFNKYHLKDHFRALRKYMLHGQGDFIIRLIELMGSTLAKPAEDLKASHLEGFLSVAIKSTNAQYDSQDSIDRIKIMLMRISENEYGWDIFTLNYNINDIRPLHAVINRSSFVCYLRTFNMLFRSRRVHYILNNFLKERNSIHRAFKQIKEVKSVLHSSDTLITYMLHFINQIQKYINFEVLECSWKKFMDSISKAVDLDTVMQNHEKFLKQVIEGCLLESESRELLSMLRTIFDLIIVFESILNDMFAKFHEELRLRMNYREQIALMNQQGKWGLDDKQEKKEQVRMSHFTKIDVVKFQNKLKAHKNQYESILIKFLANIIDHKNSGLQNLYADIDFNEIYKDRIREYRKTQH